MYPANYYYSRDHVWISVDGNSATLGITEFGQSQLGEVVAIEMPKVGLAFTAGDEIGTIESLKAIAELYIPLTGKVIAINKNTVKNPELINEDPHGQGWLIKIQITVMSEINMLMNATQYTTYLNS